MIYRNVRQSPEVLEEMLHLSGGRRLVPVIREGEKTTVGFRGT